MHGTLRDPSGRLHPLASCTDIGRAPTRMVRIDSQLVSQRHAELRWTDGRWTLTDTQSTNGTRVNGQRLEVGVPRGLRAGDSIVFGKADLGEWVLESAEPPAALARRVTDGQVIVATDGTLLLPAEEEPEATIYLDPEGTWWCEGGGRAWQVRDEEPLPLSDTWVLHLPPTSSRTIPLPSGLALDRVALHLRADRTLEYVEAWLEHADGRVSLGAAMFWPVAWVLADDRLRDDGPEHDRGWMNAELIADETGLPRKSLDTYFSRIRKCLQDAGVEDAQRVIEARPHQRRLGAIEVVLHRS